MRSFMSIFFGLFFLMLIVLFVTAIVAGIVKLVHYLNGKPVFTPKSPPANCFWPSLRWRQDSWHFRSSSVCSHWYNHDGPGCGHSHPRLRREKGRPRRRPPLFLPLARHDRSSEFKFCGLIVAQFERTGRDIRVGSPVPEEIRVEAMGRAVRSFEPHPCVIRAPEQVGGDHHG